MKLNAILSTGHVPLNHGRTDSIDLRLNSARTELIGLDLFQRYWLVPPNPE